MCVRDCTIYIGAITNTQKSYRGQNGIIVSDLSEIIL